MPLLSTQDEPKRQTRLGRDDWIVAGLAMLVDEGIDAVQITGLSKRLEVTRGSFYWHFEDRRELLAALVAEWRARNSGVMLDALGQSASLDAGILDLFSIWVDNTRFDPGLDQAVRDWARHDSVLLATVAAEDDNRVAAIAAFYESHGFETTEAFIRARVLYFTQLSYYALGIEEPMTKRMSYLSAYFLCFTGKPIDPAIAGEFCERMGDRA